MTIKTTLASLFVTVALSLAGCLALEGDDFADEDLAQTSLESVATEAEPAPAPEPLPHCHDAEPVEPRDGDADGDADADADTRACVANGYCCNTSTGNVSKTSQSGCTGSWYANLAGCLTDPVCGSPSQQCYIN